jgi:hypothetical protein
MAPSGLAPLLGTAMVIPATPPAHTPPPRLPHRPLPLKPLQVELNQEEREGRASSHQSLVRKRTIAVESSIQGRREADRGGYVVESLSTGSTVGAHVEYGGGAEAVHLTCPSRLPTRIVGTTEVSPASIRRREARGGVGGQHEEERPWSFAASMEGGLLRHGSRRIHGDEVHAMHCWHLQGQRVPSRSSRRSALQRTRRSSMPACFCEERVVREEGCGSVPLR